ncbi:MAG: T9SS type A sorting domain-containing protein [Elusimicrobia bacterium]|nr:T9SS type A sorting domain-containing protein [Elusimicrobiota bacterium]
MSEGDTAFELDGVSGARGIFRENAPAFFLCLCAVLSPAAGLFAASAGGEYQLASYSAGVAGGSVLSGGEYASKGAAAQPVLPPDASLRGGGAYTDRAGFYNPPHLTYQRSLATTLALPGSNSSLTLPSGSIEMEMFDIVLNKNAGSTQISVDQGKIDLANSRMATNEGAWALPLTGNITETYIFDEQGSWNEPFKKPGYLTLAYRDDNGDGIIDGSNPPVRADTARVWGLDEDRDMWVKLPPSGLDDAARTITIPLLEPGVFAIIATVDDSVKNAHAYPVPFRPNGGAAGIGAGKTGTAAAGITFTGLPQVGRIEIYTLDGQLVKKLPIENPASAEIKWDVRNSAGEKVRSDVYIWRIISGSNVKAGKLMIIW